MSTVDWSQPRHETYRVTVITAAGELVRLDSVSAGRLDWSAFRTIRGGGNITIVNPPDINWLAARVRVSYHYRIGTTSGEQVLGTYLVSKTEVTESAHGETWTLTLLDTVTVLAEDATPSAVAYPAGAAVTTAVREQIEAATTTPVAITHTNAVLRTPMAWPAGTPRIKIINDLLATINYFALWADPHGIYRAEPYRPPTQRTPVWTATTGVESITSTDIDNDVDYHKIPNRVVCVASGTHDTPALVGTAENTNPGSRFSRPARGRWITRIDTGVEATDQTVIDELAGRRLADASQIVHRRTIRHLWVPLALHDTVRLPDGTIMALVEQRVTLQAGAQVESTLRRTVTV